MSNAEFEKYFIWEWQRTIRYLKKSGLDLSRIKIVKEETTDSDAESTPDISELKPFENGRMLELLVKKKDLKKLCSGEIIEEYREIKHYYTSRIVNWMGFPKEFATKELDWLIDSLEKNSFSAFKGQVKFFTGYSLCSEYIICECSVRVGCKEEPGEKYFILEIKSII